MIKIINPYVDESKLDDLKIGDAVTDGGGYTDIITHIETLASSKGKLYSITTRSGIIFSVNKYPNRNIPTGD